MGGKEPPGRIKQVERSPSHVSAHSCTRPGCHSSAKHGCGHMNAVNESQPPAVLLHIQRANSILKYHNESAGKCPSCGASAIYSSLHLNILIQALLICRSSQPNISSSNISPYLIHLSTHESSSRSSIPCCTVIFPSLLTRILPSGEWANRHEFANARYPQLLRQTKDALLLCSLNHFFFFSFFS